AFSCDLLRGLLYLHSFPPRRSSDLLVMRCAVWKNRLTMRRCGRPFPDTSGFSRSAAEIKNRDRSRFFFGRCSQASASVTDGNLLVLLQHGQIIEPGARIGGGIGIG